MHEFYKAEFAALRAEIDRRSNAQQGLMVMYVTGIGVAVTVATRGTSPADGDAETPGGFAVLALLVLPFISLALATLFLDHHYKIRQIGDYIAETCTERIGMTVHWQAWNERRHGPRRRTSWWTGPFFIFACSSLWALAGTGPLLFMLGGNSLIWSLRLVWAAGLLSAAITIAVLVQAWRYGATNREK